MSGGERAWVVGRVRREHGWWERAWVVGREHGWWGGWRESMSGQHSEEWDKEEGSGIESTQRNGIQRKGVG